MALHARAAPSSRGAASVVAARSAARPASVPARRVRVAGGGEVEQLTGVVFEPFTAVRSELAVVDKTNAQVQSFARVGFVDACEAAINEQINIEYNVSYVYHALYAYFDRDNVALPGLAAFFKAGSEEEREHAELLMAYQNTRGGRVRLASMIQPEVEYGHADKGDALYAMELALSLEKLNFQKLRELHDVADAAGDAQMCDFVEGTLLAPQVQSVKQVAEYVSQLRRVGKGLGVWEFDRKLAADVAAGAVAPLSPRVRACAAGAGAGAGAGAQPGGDAPFSVELLLACARLGHLERFRAEVALLFEPGAPADLTRCALLVSNIFSPQLDHRPHYRRLEDMVARATLTTLEGFVADRARAAAEGGRRDGGRHAHGGARGAGCEGGGDGYGEVLAAAEAFDGLDAADVGHLARAAAAISGVVYGEELLGLNAADLHDPLNGSLADLLDRRVGNQWALAVVYLHVAQGLGLPCGLVGSPEHVLVRLGHRPAAVLVDVARGGRVHAWPAGGASGGDAAGVAAPAPGAAALGPLDTAEPADLDDAWHRTLHAALQQGSAGSEDAGAAAGGGFMARAGSVDEGGLLAGGAAGGEGGGEGEEELQAWREVGRYAGADAASRNSWKALYGPGALAEWGGLVSPAGSGGWGEPDAAAQPPRALGGLLGAAGFGVLESPLAAAAGLPFPSDGDGAAAAGGGSMDTCCASASDDDAHAEAADEARNNAAGGAASAGGGEPLPAPLSGAEAALRFGGLAPISARALLQQLLGATKLSLLLSGRDEEALAVIRYLRAVDPFSLPDLRDEALALAGLGQHDPAAALLREYLCVAPGAPDAGMVAEVLEQVRVAAQLARSAARRRPRAE
ncbi:PFE2 [Scenedesmus sp. PABB004]|nr:PFE2 [Scenedesmus sp. PABB004]